MHSIRPLLASPRSLLRIHQPYRYFSHSPNLRYVKIKRPWFRKFLTTCFFYAAAAHIWSSIVLARFEGALDDVEPREYPPERRALGDSKSDKPDSALFIPISWPWLQEGKSYAKSDPEYQALAKAAKDQAKLQALQNELASIVLGRVSQSSPLSHELGAPLTVYTRWLMYHFPLRAPDTYYRSGIEITETGISWVQKPMSIHGGETLRRSMAPTYVALAVGDACTAFWKSFFNKSKVNNPANGRALGPSDSSSETLLPSDLKKLDRLGNASQPDPQSVQSTSSQGGSRPIDKDAHARPSLVLSTLQWLPLPKFGPGTDLHAASLAFKRRLNEGRRRQRPARERGTIYLRGPIGIKGSRGLCRIEVEGQYNPVTSQWVSISMFVRDLRIGRQNAVAYK